MQFDPTLRALRDASTPPWRTAVRATTRAVGATTRVVAGARRHPWSAAGVAFAAVALLWLVAGGALEQWAIGLGMDEQRGELIAGLLVVAGASALGTLAGGRSLTVRCGALAGLCAFVIGPFLAGATHGAVTPGLTASIVAWGWVAQPVGMLLLGGISATAGVALGVRVRQDASALWTRLRGRRRLLLGIVPVLAIGVVGVQAATVALQDGPLSDLYSYASPAALHAVTAGGPVPVGAAAKGGTAGGTPSASGGQATSYPAGVLESTEIDRRAVDVYLPAAYATAPAEHFPVVYFLHGFPGTQSQWITGGQLPGVLDQLIGSGALPPLIAVLPDGNGQHTSDAEWGNTALGDTIETWLIDDVVPGIDAHYRTLGARYRGIAGLSAGGFGAVNLATRHPSVFDWAASYSGYFTARPDIFGSAAVANSPALTVAELSRDQRMPLYIGVGTQDREFLADTKDFVAELHRLDWTQLLSETVPGGHGWQAWRLQMVQSLTWLGKLWGPSLAHPPVA